MAEYTAAPCSISAWVVPTGALDVTSAIFSSLVVTTPLAAVLSQPRSWNSTGDGGLNGMGIAILRMSSTPGAPSISATWVTSTCWVWPESLAPLSLSIVAALLMCAESSSARSAPVSAADSPPIRWGRPIANAPRQGMNLNSTIQSSLVIVSSPSSQLRYRPITLLDCSSTIMMYGAISAPLCLSSSNSR